MEFVDLFDEKEQNKCDDKKLNDILNETSVGDNRSACIPGSSNRFIISAVQGNEQISEINLSCDEGR